MRNHLTAIRMTYHQKQALRKQKTCVGKDVENLEPGCTINGNVKWHSTVKTSVALPQKIKQKEYDCMIQ